MNKIFHAHRTHIQRLDNFVTIMATGGFAYPAERDPASRWVAKCMSFTYILWSETLRRYYVGSTDDMEKRLKEHNRGKSTFTKKGVPWKIIRIEWFKTKSEAWKREQEIKRYKGGIQFKLLIQPGGFA